jgi:hypothetical protein
MGDGFLQKDFMRKGSFAIALHALGAKLNQRKIKRGNSPKKILPTLGFVLKIEKAFVNLMKNILQSPGLQFS